MTEKLYVDFSWADVDYSTLRSKGISGVIPYFSSDPSKNVTKSDVTAIRLAKLDLLTVFEDRADNALGGTSQGNYDSALADRLAKEVGYPNKAAIYFAVDFDAQPNQYEVIRQYFREIKRVSDHPVGVYGKAAVCEMLNGIVDYYWQCEAWSGTYVSWIADLYQRIYPTKPIPGTDENVVIHECGAWLGNAVKPPAPKPKPKPTPPPKKENRKMVFVVTFTDGTRIVSDLIYYRRLTTQIEYDVAIWQAVLNYGKNAEIKNADPKTLTGWGKEIS